MNHTDSSALDFRVYLDRISVSLVVLRINGALHFSGVNVMPWKPVRAVVSDLQCLGNEMDVCGPNHIIPSVLENLTVWRANVSIDNSIFFNGVLLGDDGENTVALYESSLDPEKFSEHQSMQMSFLSYLRGRTAAREKAAGPLGGLFSNTPKYAEQAVVDAYGRARGFYKEPE